MRQVGKQSERLGGMEAGRQAVREARRQKAGRQANMEAKRRRQVGTQTGSSRSLRQ
jgi:hypothetical protein